MTTLICGSVAYDNIMVFQGRFREHILPEQIHILNISFLVPQMRREFGGCAANIAYTLKLLGGDPLVMATVGDDAEPYLDRFNQLKIGYNAVRKIPGSWTSQCFITTDFDNNQLAAFHPGAMNFSHWNKAAAFAPQVSLAIVSPDGREGMMAHCRDLAEAKVPFIFDPGQAVLLFSGEELLHMIDQAAYVCANDYEINLLCSKAGCTVEALAERVEALVVTRGAEGSWIFAEGERIEIPCIEADAVVDPTGCGDAFRAGILYGIDAGWDWRTSGRLASLMGAIKIAHQGAQNHIVTKEQIGLRYQQAYQEKLPGF